MRLTRVPSPAATSSTFSPDASGNLTAAHESISPDAPTRMLNGAAVPLLAAPGEPEAGHGDPPIQELREGVERAEPVNAGADRETPSGEALHVLALGASEGGAEALEQFFSRTPDD